MRDLYLRDRDHFFREFLSWSEEHQTALQGSWQFAARPKQLRPSNCLPYWLVSSGRGFGKTRLGAEELLDLCEYYGAGFNALICNKSINDLRKIMIYGPSSGLLACAKRRGYELSYKQGLQCIYHPSGAIIWITTPEDPDKARGIEHSYFWADELSSWRNAEATFSNILFGHRVRLPDGSPLKGCITTTPKTNTIIRSLLKGRYRNKTTVTYGSMYENAANLAESAIQVVASIFEGTTLGQQEIHGYFLDSRDSSFDQEVIDKFRVSKVDRLDRRIVSVDPSISDEEGADDAGITVVGCSPGEWDEREGFMLYDGTVSRADFARWAAVAVELYVKYDCDMILVESNQGGTGCVNALQVAAAEISLRLGKKVAPLIKTVWAKDSKEDRTDPVVALAQRGRIHHYGAFPQLEREMTTWARGAKSPNRMDAYVHGFRELFFHDAPVEDDISIGPMSAYT